MPPFQIQPCRLSDGYTIASNNVKAFWTDQTWRCTFAASTRDVVAHNSGLRGANNLLRDRAHRRNLMVVDVETGELVGYARWLLPRAGCSGDDNDPCHEIWTEARTTDPSEEERRDAEEGALKSQFGALMSGNTLPDIDAPIERMYERLRRRKETYMQLDYLAVPEEHRGKGIATMLVRRGLEEAEKLRVDSCVLAFRAALRIYLKAGYRIVDEVHTDASHGGGEKDYGAWFMERCLEKE